jgi:cell division septation protein DedD
VLLLIVLVGQSRIRRGIKRLEDKNRPRQVPRAKPKPAFSPRRTATKSTVKTASRGGAYAVRLGSYVSRKRADDSKRRLKSTVAAFLSGQKLRVERAKLSRGRVIYRVVARPFNKRAAEKACRRIAAKRNIRCKVTR